MAQLPTKLPSLRTAASKHLSLRTATAYTPLSHPQRHHHHHRRSYHSYDRSQEPPFSAAESAILSSALTHVPRHGFTTTSLRLGAQDAGYLEASTNLFPRGAFELVKYHLVTQRLGLKERVQFFDDDGAGGASAGGGADLGRDTNKKALGVGAKVRALTLARLRANGDVIHSWQQALALMAQPTHVPESIAELARLTDEIWFLAGDTSVDTSWYTKRASLSAIYSATEVFMTQDTSAGFSATEQFLDARLEDSKTLGGALGNIGEWTSYTGSSIVNVLRSKGMRI